LPFYKRSNYSTACNALSLTTHLQKRSFIFFDEYGIISDVNFCKKYERENERLWNY